MFYRKIFLYLCLFIFIGEVFAQNQNSLELFTFGDNPENALVLCFTKKNNNYESSLLQNVRTLIKNLSTSKNRINKTLIIAISHDDYTNLPNDVEVLSLVGLKSLATQILKYKNASVFIFDEGDDFNITYKTENRKAPSWILKLFINSKQNSNLKINSKTFSVEKNAKQNTNALNVFFTENIPALHIQLLPETNIDVLIFNLLENYYKFFSTDWEENFFLILGFDTIKIISEKIIVLVLEIFLILLFLLLFFQSLFRKNTMSLKKVSCIFLAYVFILTFNFLFIFIARSFTNFIFYIHLGTKNFIYFLFYYFMFFIVIWFLEIISFYIVTKTFFKKLNVNLDEIEKLYPQICFINFFILCFFDISIFVFAFLTFVVSNFFSFTKKQFSKVVVLLLSFIPTVIYFLIFLKDINSFLYLLLNKIFYVSVLLLPLFFIISEIIFLYKKYFRKKITISFGVLFLIITTNYFLFLISKNKIKIPVDIRQVFTNNKNESFITSEYNLGKKLELTNIPDKNIYATDYIQVTSQLENFLDRSIGTIKINSPLKVEAIQVFILNENGISIYEADKQFSLDKYAKFLSPQNPVMPFEINFSSQKNAKLKVIVKIFSYQNYFNTKIKYIYEISSKNYIENFLLEAEYKFDLTSK